MNKSNNVYNATEVSDIAKCFGALHALRPHLNQEDFVQKISEMMSRGYHLIYVPEESGTAGAVAGFRFTEHLHWGKAIYIDDLSTLPEHRGKGMASALLDYIHALAVEHNCDQVHLDSGCNPQRYDAHRLYLSKGFNITSHHFSYNVKDIR